MRRIDYIILHCTAGPQTQTIANIKAYWKNVLGWSKPGYHFMIEPDGTVVNTLPIEEVSNGVHGFNAHSINISYIGGVKVVSGFQNGKPINILGAPIDNRTPAQLTSMTLLVEDFSEKFPSAVILGHRDFSPDKNRNGIIEPSEWMKTCPSFSVKDWLKQINFKSKLKKEYLLTTATVNIRAGAGVQFDRLGTLNKDTQVRRLGEGNEWTYVIVPHTNQLGWISSTYLKEA